MNRILIGIDPGVQTGVAVYDRGLKSYTLLATLDFWRTFEFVLSCEKDRVTVVVENPALNKFSYARHRQIGADALKIARNAGGNCREAELLIGGLKLRGYDVTEVKPTAKKWDAEQLKRYTGHSKPTNEHVRDAMRMVFIYAG